MALGNRVIKFLLKDHYLLWVAGFSAGLVLGSRYPFSRRVIIFEILLLGLLLLIELKILYCKNKTLPVKLLLLGILPFIIFMALGHGVLSAYGLRQYGGTFAAVLEDQNINSGDIIVEGRVASHPSSRNGSMYFYLEADKLYIRDIKKEPISFSDLGEKVNIRLSGGYPGLLARDEYIRIRGELSMGSYLDPGSKTGNLLIKTNSSFMEKINAVTIAGRLFSFRKRVYDCLRNTYYFNLDLTSAGLSEALVLGNKNNIPEYLLNNFKKAGIYHLFAISGLHLSFFMGFIYFLLRKLKQSWLLFIGVILFLAGYNFLVGEKASMIRASLGVLFILIAGNWKREYSLKIILYFSYIIMMIFDPSFYYDLGFWLSFGAMAAIIFIYPVLSGSRRLYKRVSVKRIALVTLSIQLFLFPVLVYYFGEVSLAAFALNVLVLPLFYILLFILIISSGLALFWPPLGGLALKPGIILFKVILKIVNFTGRYNFYIIKFEDFTIGHIIVYYMVLLALLAAAARMIRQKAKLEAMI